MNIAFTGRIAALLVAACFAHGVHAGSFSATLPEFSGDGTNTTQVLGTFVFSVPIGETVTSAELEGHFGNSIAPTTSVHDVFADGILVASCASHESPCWPLPGDPDPWHYVFTGAELSIFSDGEVVMTTTQYDCCDFAIVREGPMTLQGLTSPVPEPASCILMLAGVAGVALASRRRTRGSSELFLE
jgi:hypothetical protein